MRGPYSAPCHCGGLQFETLERVSIALSPGNKLPRGDATIASVLSYLGMPFSSPLNGVQREVIGAAAQPGPLIWPCSCHGLSRIERCVDLPCTIVSARKQTACSRVQAGRARNGGHFRGSELELSFAATCQT